jgi:hypothetical protein
MSKFNDTYRNLFKKEGSEHEMTIEINNGSDYATSRKFQTIKAAHSAKWDSCVEHVQSKGSSAKNAYAVCTAALGEDTFKSQFQITKMSDNAWLSHVDSVLGKMVDSKLAGPVSNSLLAEQALDEEEQQTATKGIYPNEGTDTTKSAFHTHKDSVGATGKQLDKQLAASEKVTSTEQADTVANRIKTIQIKRQKATIAARKSFKQFWTGK